MLYHIQTGMNYINEMWCILGLMQLHMTNAKGGHGKESYKKNVIKVLLICKSPSKNVFLEAKIEIPAASLRRFWHCDFETDWLKMFTIRNSAVKDGKYWPTSILSC